MHRIQMMHEPQPIQELRRHGNRANKTPDSQVSSILSCDLSINRIGVSADFQYAGFVLYSPHARCLNKINTCYLRVQQVLW